MGGALAGAILTGIGYNSAITVQTPHTIFWIRAMLAIIPLVGLLLVITFILQLPLTKKICEEIRTQLEARRGKV